MKKLLAGFVLFIIMGCQSARQDSNPVIKREQSTPADYVRFLEPELENKIKVASVFKYIDGGLLGFQLNIRLDEGSPMWIEYQTVFYSEDGQEIESRFWRPQLLITKQDIGITGIAEYSTSKKFIVYIRTYTGKPTPIR